MLYFMLCVMTEPYTSSLHSAGIQFPSYVRLSAPIVDLMFMCYSTGMDCPRPSSPLRLPPLPRSPSSYNDAHGAAGALDNPDEQHAVWGVLGHAFRGANSFYEVLWAPGTGNPNATSSWEKEANLHAPFEIGKYFKRLGKKTPVKISQGQVREGTDNAQLRLLTKDTQRELSKCQDALGFSQKREHNLHLEVAQLTARKLKMANEFRDLREDAAEEALSHLLTTEAQAKKYQKCVKDSTALKEDHAFEVEGLRAEHQAQLNKRAKLATKETEGVQDILNRVREALNYSRKRRLEDVAAVKKDLKDVCVRGAEASAQGLEALARNSDLARQKLQGCEALHVKAIEAAKWELRTANRRADNAARLLGLKEDEVRLLKDDVHMWREGYAEPTNSWYERADKALELGDESLPAVRFRAEQTELWSAQNEDSYALAQELNREENTLRLMRKDLKRRRDEHEDVPRLEEEVALKVADLEMKTANIEVLERCRMVSSGYQRQQRVKNSLLRAREEAKRLTAIHHAIQLRMSGP